jgi:novobiocin biosynthesis protein NovU/D-mycarose 3-C-methyltransferase
LLAQEDESKFMLSGTWGTLRSRVTKLLEDFRQWISSRQGRVIGYGAAAKGVTLLSSAQVPRGSLSLCIDNSEAKVGRFIPGSHAEIVSEAEYVAKNFRSDDTFIIFPWNLEREISARIREFSPEASIFVALPSLREV